MPGMLQSIGLQRVGNDSVTAQQQQQNFAGKQLKVSKCVLRVVIMKETKKKWRKMKVDQTQGHAEIWNLMASEPVLNL